MQWTVDLFMNITCPAIFVLFISVSIMRHRRRNNSKGDLSKPLSAELHNIHKKFKTNQAKNTLIIFNNDLH